MLILGIISVSAMYQPRLPSIEENKSALLGLAAEIAGQNCSADDMQIKIDRYLEIGFSLVLQRSFDNIKLLHTSGQYECSFQMGDIYFMQVGRLVYYSKNPLFVKRNQQSAYTQSCPRSHPFPGEIFPADTVFFIDDAGNDYEVETYIPLKGLEGLHQSSGIDFLRSNWSDRASDQTITTSDGITRTFYGSDNVILERFVTGQTDFNAAAAVAGNNADIVQIQPSTTQEPGSDEQDNTNLPPESTVSASNAQQASAAQAYAARIRSGIGSANAKL